MSRFQAGSATHATVRATLLFLENKHDKPLKETIPVFSHHFRLDHRAVLREKLDLHGGEFALLCDPDLLAFPSPLGQPLPVPTVACLEGGMMLMVVVVMMMLSMTMVVMMMVVIMMMVVVITLSLLDNNFKH